MSLSVRDLFKQERELRFTNSGSIRLSEIEHNAYALRLTIEITDVVGTNYKNSKYLPDQYHYGYVTALKGSSVVFGLPVGYTRERVYDHINDGIWHWHQNAENRSLDDNILSLMLYRYIAAEIYEDAPFFLRMIWVLPFNEEERENYLEAQLEEIFGESLPNIEGSLVDNQNGYAPFPIVSPYPDVFKFKADRPTSFLFRLETFYLVNPAYYITTSPTDTSDTTEDEDEYPEPNSLPPGAVPDFPTPNGADPSSDPRDYGGESGEFPPGTTMRVYYTRKAYGAGCVAGSFSGQIEVGYFGSTAVSFEYIGSVNGCEGPSTAGGLRLIVPGGAPVNIAVLEEQQWALATVDNVELIYP